MVTALRAFLDALGGGGLVRLSAGTSPPAGAAIPISTTIERLGPLGLTTIVNLGADNQTFSSGPTAPQATGNHVQTQPFSKSAEALLDGGTVAPGLTALSAETISAGDTVKHDGQWLKVLRANERTVTVLLRDSGGPVRYSYVGLQGHRPADGS